MVSREEMSRLKARLRDKEMKADIAERGRERDMEARKIRKEINDLSNLRLKRIGNVIGKTTIKGGKVTLQFSKKAMKFLDNLKLEDPFDDSPKRKMPKKRMMKRKVMKRMPKKRMMKRKTKGGRR